MSATRESERIGAAAVRARGTAILRELGIDPVRHPRLLASAIVPAEPLLFRDALRDGLRVLLDAVVSRRAETAAVAASGLVGLGPGRTPLGDDYVAACAIAVARLGGPAGFGSPARERWLSALLPPRLTEATGPTSAHMLVDAVRGRAVPEVTRLLRLGDGDAALAGAVRRAAAIGATSGRGWASCIGATAMLLSDPDPSQRGAIHP